VIEARPRALVDHEVVETRPAQGRGVADELHEQGLAARPGLPQEERVHEARRLHQLGQGLPLARGQLRDVRADGHGREAGGHGGEPGRVGQGAGGGGRLRGHNRSQGEHEQDQRRHRRASPEVEGHGVLLEKSSLCRRETVNESAPIDLGPRRA
jgi:hypothetical protein